MNERQVWKYPYDFTVGEAFAVFMPSGAQILHADMQGNIPTIWALVDPEAIKEPRSFRICGTGHPLPSNRPLLHVGTMQSGAFVWHIFEILEEKE